MASALVVVPVFNGHDATARCIEALARNTPPAHGIVLVDDASTDPRIAALLRDFASRRADARVVTNPRNLGFAGAVAAGLAGTRGDFVVLNSDTEVGSGWIEGLLRCRDSHARVGIVCPLSNRATILSLPGVAELFALPDGKADIDAIAACVARASRREYPRIPTAVGFCMLVRQEVWEQCGPFDALYGRGYGEENDLSMRALDRGWEIACCDDVYVHHAGEASFGDVAGIEAAREANRMRLERRWPAYAPGVRAWAVANPLRRATERVNAAAERERMPGCPRVLQVLHRLDSRGGIEEHTRAFVSLLRNDVASTLVLPDGPRAWTDFATERLTPHLRIARLNPERMTPGIRVIGHEAAVADEGVEDAFRDLLSGGYDVVHFQSLVGWNSLRLPRIARESGARVVITAHDFSYQCADYNMMTGPQDMPCGRAAARGADGGCVACLRGRSAAVAGPTAPASVSGYLESRFAAAADAVDAADVIVCPSEYAAMRMRKGFGEGCAPRLRVIGHGVADLPLLPRPEARPVLRVAFLGRFGGRKGAHLIIEAGRRLAGQRIAIEAWGLRDLALEQAAGAAGIVQRGAYVAADLPRILSGIDLVLLPSTMEETFCLVLSEAQRLGIPVAGARDGAIPERVRDGETGFLLPHGDAGAIAALLLRLRDDRAALDRVAENLKRERPKTIEVNAAEYLALYRELAVQREHEPVEPSLERRASFAAERLGFPRQRACTPLGSDAYDRWMARQPATTAASPIPVALETIVLSREEGDEGAAIGRINRAIADAKAGWIVMVEEGDRLAEGALAALTRAIERNPRAALLYACSDAMSTRGERYDPAFLPTFGAELLRHHPCIAGLCALRREALLERGGLRAVGWAGVTDLALRLAEEGRADAVIAIRELLVHRLDLNIAAQEGEAARERHRRVVAEHFRRTKTRAMLLPAAADAPASWARAIAVGAVSAFVASAEAPERLAACIEALVKSSRDRIGDVYVDLDAKRTEALAGELAGRGLRTRLTPVGGQPGSAWARAIRNAATPWIVFVDARCDQFRAGWLERLEQGIAGASTAIIAPDLLGPGGARIAGWEIAGGGPWAVSGAPPRAQGEESLGALYGSPREVSVASWRLALVNRDAVLSAQALREIDRAGSFAMAHLCLGLRAAGFDILARPFVAAEFPLPADARPDALVPVAQLAIPPEEAWMRERWLPVLDDDPHYHPALRLGGEGFGPEEGFTPRGAGVQKLRLCAFPFDHWGSGEARVRQPCAALERAGRAEVVMMAEHATGTAPNRVEWQRLDPDVVLAHNFFHNYQLASLDVLARHGRALKVVGLDDLLTQLPAGNPYAATIYPDIAQRIARAVALCDRLVVSTAPLAEAFGRGAKEVRVIPNAIDAERWKGLANRPAGGARPRVGWAGAKQHAEDLELLEPLVRATHREIDWVFLGLCTPELAALAAEVHDMVPIERYPEKLASLALDVAVAPLRDNPFNRAKSHLKLLEYGFLGIPVVASDLEPYRGAPAVLARDGEWFEAVRGLAGDRDAALVAGARLRDWVEKNHTLAGNIAHWTRAVDPDKATSGKNTRKVTAP